MSPRLDGGAARQQRAPATFGLGERAREVQHDEVVAVVHVAAAVRA
jgi:hypothetical protein